MKKTILFAMFMLALASCSTSPSKRTEETAVRATASENINPIFHEIVESNNPERWKVESEEVIRLEMITEKVVETAISERLLKGKIISIKNGIVELENEQGQFFLKVKSKYSSSFKGSPNKFGWYPILLEAMVLFVRNGSGEPISTLFCPVSETSIRCARQME